MHRCSRYKRRQSLATAEGRGKMFISRMSRAAAEDSFAATRLMHRGSVTHGLQPWLSSVTATRLEFVSQVCWYLGQGGVAARSRKFCEATNTSRRRARKRKRDSAQHQENGCSSHRLSVVEQTTRPLPTRRLRDIFLRSRPPLLVQGGEFACPDTFKERYLR